MMSLSQIHELSDEAARKARRHSKKPYVIWPAEADRIKLDGSFPFPFIGSYRPKGWKLVETYFVSTGFGRANEPALTVEAFRSKLKVGMGYAIIEAGEFQVYVGEFEPPTTLERELRILKATLENVKQGKLEIDPTCVLCEYGEQHNEH